MPLIRRLTAISLTALLAAAILITGWNAATHHVLPWQAAPGTIHWCGRDYVNTTGVRHTLAEIRVMEPRPVRNVGYHVPLNVFGSQLYASVPPAAQRHTVSPPLPCSMSLYLGTASGHYLAYTLSGGP